MKENIIDIDINTLDKDILEFKEKYLNTIKKYSILACEIFIQENKGFLNNEKNFIKSIDFSFHNGGYFEIDTSSFGVIEINLVDFFNIDKNNPFIYIWIDTVDFPDTTLTFSLNNSLILFKEAYNISNNLELFINGIFEEYSDFSYLIKPI